MTENRTEINDLGEFGLIEKIREWALETKHEDSLLGIGDDAALIASTKGEDIVVSSDMLNEGIHFDLSYMPLMHLGYKSVSVNVSDLAAMNARPSHVFVNIGLSNRFSYEAVEVLYRGIIAACKDYGVELAGGDTTSSASGLIISITAVGKVKPESKTLRSGAKKGDIICVTGDLGAAYLGLQVLEREKAVFKENPSMQPKLEEYQYLVQRQLKPRARMDIVHEFKELGVTPTSMMDVSDGLASELLHMSKASNVGMKIYEENLPIDGKAYETAVEFLIDSASCILNGGEDYELVFTIDQKDHSKLEKHPDIHFIGYVQEAEKGNIMITKNENIKELKAQGFKHF